MSEAKSRTEERKEKIRQRYKGVSADELDVIPALPKAGLYEDEKEKRVAVYVRVSTDDPNQTSSYELQKNHYEDLVNNHKGWRLVEIYADEGISGTSLNHRESFIRMIEDCKAGRIDLIVTKSVSRFARNVLDCIGYSRELASMQPPIGIFFETENIYTLNSNSEMALSFIATLAQEESHTKSEIMNASIEMRFKRGVFLTPVLLGYDQDDDGNLIINEDEAKTVRLIFFMYLYGYTCQQIANTLTSLERKTKIGNTEWSPGSILEILKNERHCGDILARKTWTPNYLDHKSKKNNQDRNQYRQRDHHEAIISRDDYVAVQRLIHNARYKSRSILPELHVITSGALTGYIAVNTIWAGFTRESYMHAYEKLDFPPEENSEPMVFEAHSGDFDLRGYQVAKGQFFSGTGSINVTFGDRYMKFSTEAVRKFDTPYVEILVEPRKKLLAVRPSEKHRKYARKWYIPTEKGPQPRYISGSAFLPALYEIFGWDQRFKYRMLGTFQENESERVLVFSLQDSEAFIPNDIIRKPDEEEKTYINAYKNTVHAYPKDIINGFGSGYYRQAQALELRSFDENQTWDIDSEGVAIPMEAPIKVRSSEEIAAYIDKVIEEMRQEARNDANTIIQ